MTATRKREKLPNGRNDGEDNRLRDHVEGIDMNAMVYKKTCTPFTTTVETPNLDAPAFLVSWLCISLLTYKT